LERKPLLPSIDKSTLSPGHGVVIKATNKKGIIIFAPDEKMAGSRIISDGNSRHIRSLLQY
jgi:hypothetical protein